MKLTKAQLEWVAWALDGMDDYVEEEDCDYPEEEIPTLEGSVLDLSNASRSSLGDLLHRLEQQAPDMVDVGELGSCSRAAENAAARIRTVVGWY